jgi:hypothetical protein
MGEGGDRYRRDFIKERRRKREEKKTNKLVTSAAPPALGPLGPPLSKCRIFIAKK